jgi:hypothetical protein
MVSLPIPRTSFLDSRLRLRGRTNRLLAKGLPVNDAQLDPVAHVGRPGAAPTPNREQDDRPDVP